jgi:hypothetical protein
MKYKEGQQVRIVSNRITGHRYPLFSIVTLETKCNGKKWIALEEPGFSIHEDEFTYYDLIDKSLFKILGEITKPVKNF